jgi:hypothetical protein
MTPTSNLNKTKPHVDDRCKNEQDESQLIQSSFPVHLDYGQREIGSHIETLSNTNRFSTSTHRDAQDRHPTALRSRRISGRDFDLPCARLCRELPKRPRRILAASVVQKDCTSFGKFVRMSNEEERENLISFTA